MEENKTKTIRNFKEMEDDLNKKLNQELYDFKEELLQTEPQNILDNAYKVVVMQEIMDYLLCDRSYTRTELNSLLESENLLLSGYDEWLSYDGNFREMLEYSTDNLVDIIAEDYHREMEKKLSEKQVDNSLKSASGNTIIKNKEAQINEPNIRKNEAR